MCGGREFKAPSPSLLMSIFLNIKSVPRFWNAVAIMTDIVMNAAPLFHPWDKL